MRRRSAALGVGFVVGLFVLASSPRTLIGQIRVQSIAAITSDAVRDWDNAVNSMMRSGELRLASQQADTLVSGRTMEQIDQYHDGVRVWGGDIRRQLEPGRTISVFGTLYAGITLDTTPALSPDDARGVVSGLAGGAELGPSTPELLVLPLDDGTYALVYRCQLVTADDASAYFVDAKDGRIRLKLALFENQGAIVTGTGVLNDTKKVSVRPQSGAYVADDQLRPPSLRTFDLRGNFPAAIDALNGVTTLGVADLATGPTTGWTDGANVDAHVYEGYTYDYYFKRFGRRGLNNQDARIVGITHTVRLQDIFTAPASVVGQFYINAFYCHTCGSDGRGTMVYGEGLPNGVVLRVGAVSIAVKNFAGALDVVAHELTHGVTAYSSRLISLNEAGALNEAFSDMMGSSVAAYTRAAAGGQANPNYLMGADIFSPPVAPLVRSLQDPLAYGTPDHYSKRLLDPGDNGEVHSNSTIASHAFYLAIEGGTNRTSGLAVQGVGSSNREQVEKVFYRGFTQLLSSNATFSMARAATIQAARDLYGVGTPVERAVIQAWTAVGVN